MACVHAFDCLLLFLLTIQGAGGKNTTTSLPNIIVFLVDDLGYGDLGFTGHPSTRTPELDRLAAEGRRLTNWYTGYPVCSASRTALLTGRQPPRVGMVGVLNSLSKVGLPLSETTVADALRDRAGYATLALGKWHQGQLPAYLPTARGFDEFYGLPFSVDDGVGYVSSCGAGDKDVEEEDKRLLATVANYDLGLGPSLPLPKLRQVNGTNVIEQQPTDLTPLTAGLVNSTVDFLRRQRTEQPVFVWFAFGHVHTTGLEDQMQYSGCGWAGATPRGAFGDGLAEVDGAVGAVLAEVRALGRAADTLSIFVSDNGPAMRWGTDAGDVGIFRGAAAAAGAAGGQGGAAAYSNTGKGSTWEGGIRMPAFAHWPGTVEAGSVSGTVVSSLDLFPSLLRLAGITDDDDDGSGSGSAATVIDGKESLLDAILWPSAKGDAPTLHDFLPFYNNVNIANASRDIFAARYGRYKAHWLTSPGLLVGEVAEVTAHEPPLVFDVEADPAEAWPLDPPPEGLLAALADAKAAYEAQLAPTAIDPTFGYEWALCCGVGCTPNEDGSCECTCEDVMF